MNSAQPMTYREWAALLVASLAMFLNTVDISILNVALPVIERELGVGMRLLQWLQGAYGLSYAGFLLLSGRLADLIGRRRVFLGGVALFGVASLAGSVAPSFAILLAARAIQGLGAALMVPSAISIISTTFGDGPLRNRALGIFSAVAATGFSSGLVSGALITEFASWRWVFFVNVPITAVILGIAPTAVQPNGVEQRKPIDLLGASLVTAGLLAIVYTITTRRSIIHTGLAAAAAAAAAALLGSSFGFFFLVSMYLQFAAGFSSLEAGFALLPMSVVSALVSGMVAPRVAGRFGARRTLKAGIVLNAIGIGLFVLCGPGHALIATICASVVLGGLGMGLGYPACNLAALEGIPGELQGAVSGFQNTCLQTGGAIGTALAATALSSFGGAFSSLAPADQGGARTLAAIVLAAFALLGAVALSLPDRTKHPRQCVCDPRNA